MSKFRIPTKSALGEAVAEVPRDRQEFAAGASLVQSQATSRGVKPVRINFDLDPTKHRQLKLRAIDNGETVADLIRRLIERELA